MTLQRQGNINSPSFKKTSGKIASYAAAFWLALSPIHENKAIAEYRATPTIIQEQQPPSNLDWKRTQMIIINGSKESWSLKNTDLAYQTGTKHAAAGIYLAGFTQNPLDGTKRFNLDIAGISELFKEVEKNSKSDDRIFVYWTGHGFSNGFALENNNNSKAISGLTHKELTDLFKTHFKARDMIILTDSCYSGTFIENLRTNVFRSLIAMSPGPKDELVYVSDFSAFFWRALEMDVDADGDGKPSIQEAFRLALREYRNTQPKGFGTYIENIPKISEIGNVKNGIVMITNDSCSACRLMEPRLNKLNMLAGGQLKFYLIDSKHVENAKSFPEFIAINGGKVQSKTSGEMDIKDLIAWVNKNNPSKFQITQDIDGTLPFEIMRFTTPYLLPAIANPDSKFVIDMKLKDMSPLSGSGNTISENSLLDGNLIFRILRFRKFSSYIGGGGFLMRSHPVQSGNTQDPSFTEAGGKATIGIDSDLYGKILATFSIGGSSFSKNLGENYGFYSEHLRNSMFLEFGLDAYLTKWLGARFNYSSLSHEGLKSYLGILVPLPWNYGVAEFLAFFGQHELISTDEKYVKRSVLELSSSIPIIPISRSGSFQTWINLDYTLRNQWMKDNDVLAHELGGTLRIGSVQVYGGYGFNGAGPFAGFRIVSDNFLGGAIRYKQGFFMTPKFRLSLDGKYVL